MDLTWQGASLDDLIRHVFGTNARIVELETVKDAPDYRVAIARIAAPALRVVIKLAGEHPPYPCDFERSAALYRRVAQHTDIAMPEIYAVDESGRAWPGRYLVKSYLPGVEWAQILPGLSPDERDNALAQVGRAAAQLHAIEFPSFGELTADGMVAAGGALLPALRARARRWIADGALLDFFLLTLEARAAWFREQRQAGLTHEDLHHHNLLFTRQGTGWRLATILDFDKAWAGPPESDLARLALWRGMSAPALWQAYEELRPIDPGFAERRAVYQMLWCLEYASPSADHWADTQAVCAELGVRMPKRFDDASGD